jgi:CRISPR-associated protein Cas1
MSYHIVNIDSPQCSISCKHGQLTCRTGESVQQIPLEDVAAIVITSFSANIHSHLLLQAAKYSIALIICHHFMPVSLMLPVNRCSDTLLTKAALSIDKKKLQGLWKKTVDAKCYNQYSLASQLAPEHPKLERLQRVAEGKSHSKESTAARYYWQIFGDGLCEQGFLRNREQAGLNDLLNFGYAILLSTLLQKLLAIGLDPTIGIHHEVREQSVPLAYDLMEPFRPCVDARVARWVREKTAFKDYRITQEFRAWISEFVLERVGYFGIELTLVQCIESVARSFRQAVLEHNTRRYKPWTPSDSKWAGYS